MQKIQRFGGAMITPVLLFAVFGIVVGITTFLQQEIIFGEIVAEGTLYNQILTVIQDGGWTVFNQLNILFVVGLPIGLANKNQGHASMSAFVLYMTFTYMLSSMLGFWGDNFGVDFSLEPEAGSGLANVAGVKTLDTGMIGALIIAGIVIFLHNKFFDKRLPDWLATFSGAPTVVAIGFVVMLPVAFLFLAIWPQVQILIDNLQSFITSSGLFGIGIFMFLERLLIPTGMHHLLAKPLEFR
jgi:Phosphotransferase system IIC components, glucose/maltose/N-acetylglucosamine-specific